MHTYAVTVPPGVGPGEQFEASLDGRRIMVVVPRGSKNNSTLHVQIPVQACSMQQYSVTVPDGVQPGGRFRANLGGQLVSVRCPAHLGPGKQMIVDAVKTNQALRSRAHSALSRRVRLGTVVLAPTSFAMMLILTVVTLRAGGPELDRCEMLLMLLHMATLIGFPALYAAICPVDFPEGGAGYGT